MHATGGAKGRRWPALLVIAALAVGGTGCSDGADEAAPTTTAASSAGTDFSERGPFSVGVLETTLPGGAPVEVFYPAGDVSDDAAPYGVSAEDMWGSAQQVWPVAWDLDVPDAWREVEASAEGPFPLVVSSHGWGGSRFVHASHLAHLASWGFVVAAPEHESRDIAVRTSQDTLPPNDVRTVLAAAAQVRSLSSAGDGTLAGVVKPDALAVEGHSAGGRDAVLAASTGEVDTYISVAGTPPVADDVVAPGELFALEPGIDLAEHLATASPPEVPGLLIVSEEDGVVPPEDDLTTYAWLQAPKRLVVIAGTGHVAYFDGCGPYQDGDLPGLVDALGMDPASTTVAVSNDGCTADDPPGDEVRSLWNHLTVAQLRWALGDDAEDAAASLEPDFLEETFPGMVAEVEAEG